MNVTTEFSRNVPIDFDESEIPGNGYKTLFARVSSSAWDLWHGPGAVPALIKSQLLVFNGSCDVLIRAIVVELCLVL